MFRAVPAIRQADVNYIFAQWYIQDKKPTLPPSIANLTLEDSQKLNVDTLKKLKARDKKIADLTAANEKLTVQHSDAGSSSSAAQVAAIEVC